MRIILLLHELLERLLAAGAAIQHHEDVVLAQVVRDAARIGAGLALTALPEISELPHRLTGPLSTEPAPSSADLRRASDVIERTLDYLAAAYQTAQG